MRVIVLLIAIGGLVAGGFLGAFAWAVHNGQFDDTVTPAVRILDNTDNDNDFGRRFATNKRRRPRSSSGAQEDS